MKKQIIIDIGSSTSVMCDPAHCDKIEKSDKVPDLGQMAESCTPD